MQAQTKFGIFFNNINTNFFSEDPKLPLIPYIGHSPNIKKLFFPNVTIR